MFVASRILQAAERGRRPEMNECVQQREFLEVARHGDRISLHLFGERCLANPLEYDAPPAADLPDSPECGNGDSHFFYCCMDRRFTECRGLCYRRPIEFNDADVTLEYLGSVSSRE
jgi:hypothetical protein